MTKDDARRIVGNQPTTCIANMALALSMHSWSNTQDDWQRMEAACVLLGPRAPKRARDALLAHKASLIRALKELAQ